MKVKIKAKSGKRGTRIAVAQFRVTPSDKPQGKPFYRTRAQMNVYLWKENGEPRARNRSD